MEVDAAIQDERAVKFDLYTCGRLRILISFLPNMRSQMRENARPIFAESGRSFSSTIRRYTYGRDMVPVLAVLSLGLVCVYFCGHDKHPNPLSTAGGPAVATIPRPPGSDRSARASLWSVSPQASAVLTDAGDPRLGSHSVADAPRRQISLYPGSHE